ncbi:uncharacterized protein EAE97_009220 [Botrytis byssoidea]|uniref:Uncharacterized protein n=1 Tax=Botrytis byssoidea TaxID=139641 RepID=A0A9P5I5G2_9HELO|nr:uncharacterized protein EAE97_009220 [Botrytis byssoidea]KAF7931011.1 hypothetical protein EAE97_009220 [Botrytis byssoidea]
MLPRGVPPYPGPLYMPPEQHYELVEARALITEQGDRILFEEEITLNVDFGTGVEERHVEGCVCVVCGEVERGMGRRTVITGGVEGERGWGGEEEGEKGEKGGEFVCADEKRDDDHDDNDHDGECLFVGTGKMSQVKISKPLSPEIHRMRSRKPAGSSTASISTVSSMPAMHADELEKRNASLGQDCEYQVSEMDSSEETEHNSSGVAIAYSHAPSPSSRSGENVSRERGRGVGQSLHATWDSRVENKDCWSDTARDEVAGSLSKRSLSTGRSRDKERESDSSAGLNSSKAWNFAQSLSRRSNNSGHSTQTIRPAEGDHVMLGAQMDGSGSPDQHSSFEEGESLNMSFRGDEDIMEPRDGARPFIGPRRNPEIHDFPRFDPQQFTPSKNTHAAPHKSRRRSGSESDVSTLGPQEARSRSPSLRSRHYSSRGSFSLNWDNISSDTVYHKHARRFYQNPAAYGAEIPGYNPETDNPYLAYDRYQEVSEWADSTEEADPDHVVALTTRELKRLCGAEIRVPFDFVPEGYVNPPPSRAGSVVGDGGDVVTILEMHDDGDDDDDELGSEPRHKNLVDLLGMPGWAHEWEDMTKMQRHFHIVAAGDWRMGPAFDVKSNYSDYFGVPLFEPNDVGLNGVNRREVRGLEIPGLKELELRFRLEGCEGERDGHKERRQRRCSDEDVKTGSPTEYDSDGFLYDDDTGGEATGNFDPTESTGSEANRFSRRPSEVSLSNRSGDGSEEGDYAGSIVEGYDITDDHRTGANINIRTNDSFRGHMARSYTFNSRSGQDILAPSNADSIVSEEPYDTDDDEDYESDDGVSANYSFGNSSYHGTECQEDYAIGTSKFVPHAFQLYPPYEAASDCTTIGIAPSKRETTRPASWDADFMEDILGYSVHEETHKPHDPTAEMVIMSYLDPVPTSRRSSSRSRSSTGSLTPVPSPTKSAKTTRSFVPTVKSLSRAFAKNRSLPPTPEDAPCEAFSKPGSKSASSLRKSSLSTANIAKLNNHKPREKPSLSKPPIKLKPKHKPLLRLLPRKSKTPAPPSSTSSSNSNTSYVDLTRSGSAYAVPPAQSLILYLHGRGLSADHIAYVMQTLDEKFLYDSNSNWWPLDHGSCVSTTQPMTYLHPAGKTPLSAIPLCADAAPSSQALPPQKINPNLNKNANTTPIRFPSHTLFTPCTVSQVLHRCTREEEWWEVANARDADGKKLPGSFRRLKKGMRVRKARGLVRKTVENFLWWRIGGGVGVPHGNLMRG